MPVWLLSPTVWMLLALAAAGAYGWFEHAEAERYQAERDAATAQRDALGSQIATQNQAVANLKADGDRKMADAVAMLAKLSSEGVRYMNEAESLRAAAKAASSQRGPSAGCAPSGADKAVVRLREGLL